MAISKQNRLESTDVDPPDGGYGWAVTFGAFMVFFIIGGQTLSFGVLYVEFLDAFGASKANTALIGSIYLSTALITYPLTTAFMKKYGHRRVMAISGVCTSVGLLITSFTTNIGQVYVIYGIFTGLWFWVPVLPTLAILGQYFTRRHALAVAFALSGTGAGQIAFSFVVQLLLDEYGWRGTLLILSAFNLNICVAGSLFKPIELHNIHTQRKRKSGRKYVTANLEDNIDASSTNGETIIATEEVNETRQGSCPSSCRSPIANHKNCCKGAFDWSLFRKVAFVLIIICGFATQFGAYSITSHIVKRGRDYGIPSLRSSSLPAIMGMTQFLGRIFWGLLGGVSTKLKPIMLYGSSIALAGISTIISIHTTTYTGQLIYMVVFGICMACFVPTFPVVMRGIVGTMKMDHGNMYYVQAQSVGAMVGSPFVGWTRDIEGNYDVGFYFIGALLITTAICAFLAPLTDKYIDRRKEEKETNMLRTFSYERHVRDISFKPIEASVDSDKITN